MDVLAGGEEGLSERPEVPQRLYNDVEETVVAAGSVLQTLDDRRRVTGRGCRCGRGLERRGSL